MLKVLFPKSCHYQYSRFGAELELFARWLLAVGYLPGAAARRHVRRLKRILEATAALQCGQFIREAELEEALALVPGALRDASTERAYLRFLEAERRLEETKPKGPLEHLLLRYREYL